MYKISKDELMQLVIEALKSIMCNTNIINCRAIKIECDAHVSIDQLTGVTIMSCVKDKVDVIIDYGRDLVDDDWVVPAASLSIYLNSILNNNGISDNVYVQVVPITNFTSNITSGFTCMLRQGNSRVNYIQQLYKFL